MKQVEGLATKLIKDMTDAAGKYLHNLDVEEDSDNEVKVLV